MASIPKELDEAAMIDGANRFQIYCKIVIPLCVPVLIVVGMFAFTGAWNDYLWPSIVMNKIDMLTITPSMQKIKDGIESVLDKGSCHVLSIRNVGGCRVFSAVPEVADVYKNTAEGQTAFPNFGNYANQGG